MELERATTDRTGVPEFTELGKRIEMLRIERGLSKQHLARHAGTSRQQLWRVMTGKSELTLPLRTRLAEAVAVATFELDNTESLSESTTLAALAAATPATFDAYARDPD